MEPLRLFICSNTSSRVLCALLALFLAVGKSQLTPPEFKAEHPLMPPKKIPPIITAQVYLDVHAEGYKKEISGRIVLGLYGESCPRTVDNFLSLIEGIESANDTERKSWLHYKGSKFHRVLQHFMIQGGDITHGNGVGGESIYGRTFQDEECIHEHIFDKPFLLAMANRGPNTNNSQFFITTVKTRWLDSKHMIFGKVLEGYDVVKSVESLGTASGKPSTVVTILDCGVLENSGKGLRSLVK